MKQEITTIILRDFIIDKTSGAAYMFIIFPLVGFLLWGFNAITYLIAPEWFAIKEISTLF